MPGEIYEDNYEVVVKKEVKKQVKKIDHMRLAKKVYIDETNYHKNYESFIYQLNTNDEIDLESSDRKAIAQNRSNLDKGALLGTRISQLASTLTYNSGKAVGNKPTDRDDPEYRQKVEARLLEVGKVADIAIPMFLENHARKYLEANKISKADLRDPEFVLGFESTMKLPREVKNVVVTPSSLTAFASEISKTDLEGMTDEELINMGYVRVPEYTKADGSKVQSHIRKLG